MKGFLPIVAGKRRQAGLVIVLAFGLLAAAAARGQVQDPISIDPTVDPANAGLTPEDTTRLTIPNLSTVNESADAVQYSDRELGTFNLGIELRAGWSDNLFNSPRSSQSGLFTGFGVPVGVRTGNRIHRFNANYRIDQNYYPSFTDADNTSHIYAHQLEHRSSERTTYYWDVAAGRITSLGQYLPSVIPIGGTGVAQAPVGAGLAESSYINTNISTSGGVLHRFTERDSIFSTVTAGWLEQAQKKAVPGTARTVLRSEFAGLDATYEHALNERTSVGAEITNVYIRGLAPRGHVNFTTVNGIYRRQLSNHFFLRVGAGPLYSVTRGVASGNSSGKSDSVDYSASASVEYRIPHTRISGGYSRVYQIGYLQTADIAHQISAVFDRELTSTVDATLDARYVRNSGSSSNQQNSFGITGRVNKRIGSNFLVFVSASRSQQTTPSSFSSNHSYNRDDFFGGFTILLGNPIYSRGVH